MNDCILSVNLCAPREPNPVLQRQKLPGKVWHHQINFAKGLVFFFYLYIEIKTLQDLMAVLTTQQHG